MTGSSFLPCFTTFFVVVEFGAVHWVQAARLYRGSTTSLRNPYWTIYRQTCAAELQKTHFKRIGVIGFKQTVRNLCGACYPSKRDIGLLYTSKRDNCKVSVKEHV